MPKTQEALQTQLKVLNETYAKSFGVPPKTTEVITYLEAMYFRKRDALFTAVLGHLLPEDIAQFIAYIKQSTDGKKDNPSRKAK